MRWVHALSCAVLYTTAQGTDIITSGRNNKLTYNLLSDVDRDSIVHEDKDRSGATIPHIVHGIERPGGERPWDSGAMGPLYDAVRHTGDFLDYSEYMRPINGEWC